MKSWSASVAWVGRSAAVVDTVARRYTLVDAAHADVVIVAGSAPQWAGSAPWIWWSPRAVPVDALADAVTRGALDVIVASDSSAVERLMRRLLSVTPREVLPVTTDFVAESPAAKRALLEIHRAAQTSMSVLLVGETGAGKEVAAHLIHAWSARAKKPFIPINCAAIPNELMEAELFGYQRGAFSGAVHSYDGRLVAAAGGTVFLDEVDDTPYATQMKLLRVLEDKVVSRLGEDAEQTVDFRIVAATNRDLQALIRDGSFGEDLYERLAIVTVRLPPLRERKEDLEPLARHFIKRFYGEEPRAKLRHDVRSIDPMTLEVLARHPWPGNVRELRNVVYAALVQKAAGDELLVSDLPRHVLEKRRSVDDSVVTSWARERVKSGGGFDLVDAVAALERAALEAALEASGNNASGAARLLGRVGRGSARDPGGTVRAMMRRLAH